MYLFSPYTLQITYLTRFCLLFTLIPSTTFYDMAIGTFTNIHCAIQSATQKTRRYIEIFGLTGTFCYKKCIFSYDFYDEIYIKI